MTTRKAAVVGSAVLMGGILLGITSCSSTSVAPVPAASPLGDVSSTTASGGHSMMGGDDAGMMDADSMFLVMMIPHHEQAVEMSHLASSNGAGSAVQQLADEIAAAQGPEIEQMQVWLDEAHVHDMMDDGSMAMGGMLSASQLSALKAARGAEFDRLYLEGMIGHHEGAIAMAQDEIDSGDDPRVVALAKKIIAAQTAEIARMKQMLGS